MKSIGTNQTALQGQRKTALVAGVGYLVIFFSGIFANFFVVEGLYVPGSAAETIENIANNMGQFRLGVLSFVLMVVADLVLTWSLFVLFRQANEKLSMFAAAFRLVNVAIFGMALAHLAAIPGLVGGNVAVGSFTQSAVMQSFAAFNNTWLIGLVFFGVHLLALAALTMQSRSVPRVIAALLCIAGVGYLLDTTARFGMQHYDAYKTYFSMAVIVPGVVGEFSFTIWLLVRGGSTKRDKHPAVASSAVGQALSNAA
ncbi:MAG: DUF4386 domain-containing protein [Taibaiella sp.]|nr:DUF4386 domain-containing protein [Taibaiella sp.]